jgi:hypothetical protein
MTGLGRLMKASNYWPTLRVSAIGWIVALCLLAGALGIVLQRQSVIEEHWRQAKKQLQQRQQQLTQQASDQPEIAFFLAHRSKWQALGVMQAPDFDRWDAALVAMQQQFALPHVSYQMQPSLTCAASTCQQQWPTAQPPAFNISVTPIQLTWSVAHESDVMGWLQKLQRADVGLLLLRRCHWRLAAGADLIAAQCDLDLFNFPHVLPVELMGAP